MEGHNQYPKGDSLSRPMTPEERAEFYNRGKGIDYALDAGKLTDHLVSWWNFDEEGFQIHRDVRSGVETWAKGNYRLIRKQDSTTLIEQRLEESSSDVHADGVAFSGFFSEHVHATWDRRITDDEARYVLGHYHA